MKEIFRVHPYWTARLSVVFDVYSLTMMETKQSGFFNIAAVRPAAAFTLFVYISKWNALSSNNKFKNYWILGVAMQIAKYLTHFQPSPCVN